jgi:hypothetical protein
MSSNNNSETSSAGGIIVLVLFVVICIALAWDADKKKDLEKQHGKETWEFIIEEKYEPIGSNFHLIGGRSSETEYHIVFKSRCVNRPDDSRKSEWQRHDEEVNYLTYRYYQTGKSYKFYQSSGGFIPRQY